MNDEGKYSMIVRLLLSSEQRGRLYELCYRERIDVVDALTNIVASYLDRRDDLTPSEPAVSEGYSEASDRDTLRRQLRQLRSQASRLGNDAPPWLYSYIRDLEQELGRTG